MPSTCSARYSDSRKSQRCPSPLSPATLCRSRRLWLTVFSSSRAASMASSGVPHSMVVGMATSWKTTLPTLLFWYSIRFMQWARSSQDSVLKCPANPWRAWSSRLNQELMEIDVRGIEFHVDLLVDQRLAVLMVVLPDLG